MACSMAVTDEVKRTNALIAAVSPLLCLRQLLEFRQSLAGEGALL